MNHTNANVLILDQGEVLGGAEHYMMDFLGSLTLAQIKTFKPLLLGGHHRGYQSRIGQQIPRQDFVFPSTKGNIFQKIRGGFGILWAGRRLAQRAKQANAKMLCTNSPRAHFIAYMACTFWGARALSWTLIFHDLTTQKKLWKPLHIFLRKRMLRRATHVVAVSVVTRTALKALMPSDQYNKIQIIENGVQIETLPEPKQPQKIQTILHIGRISPEKGQIYTLQAASILKDFYPDLRFRIVGPVFSKDNIAKQYYDECKTFAQKNNLTNVEFVGEVLLPWEEIQNADCVLSIMTKPEAFGRVLIEGLALNKLVISSTITGPSEIMRQYLSFINDQNLKTYLLIPPNDSLALTKSLEYFLQNPQSLAPCTQYGRDFVHQHYGFAATKKRLYDLLQRA